MGIRNIHLQRNLGFTLIELVVTAAFMGIVIVAISGLFISLKQINRTTNNYTIAKSVAQQEIETLRNTPYAGITVGTTDLTSVLLTSYPSLLSPRAATLTVTQIITGVVQADILVSWTDRTGVKKVEMTTQISSIGLNR